MPSIEYVVVPKYVAVLESAVGITQNRQIGSGSKGAAR